MQLVENEQSKRPTGAAEEAIFDHHKPPEYVRNRRSVRKKGSVGGRFPILGIFRVASSTQIRFLTGLGEIVAGCVT